MRTLQLHKSGDWDSCTLIWWSSAVEHKCRIYLYTPSFLYEECLNCEGMNQLDCGSFDSLSRVPRSFSVACLYHFTCSWFEDKMEADCFRACTTPKPSLWRSSNIHWACVSLSAGSISREQFHSILTWVGLFLFARPQFISGFLLFFLPLGCSYLCRNYRRYFYTNVLTGDSQWDYPDLDTETAEVAKARVPQDGEAAVTNGTADKGSKVRGWLTLRTALGRWHVFFILWDSSDAEIWLWVCVLSKNCSLWIIWSFTMFH